MATIIAFPDTEIQDCSDYQVSHVLAPKYNSSPEVIEAAEGLITIACDSDIEVERRLNIAAHVAATFGGPLLCERFLPHLDAPDPNQRQVAALMLGFPGNLVAIFPLVALLDDPVMQVRRAAVEALAGIRDVRVLSFLLGVLDRDDELVGVTLSALKFFPIAHTEPIFRRYLDSDDAETCLTALGAYVFAPAVIATPVALDFLEYDDPRHRGLAVTILEASKDRKLLEPLFPMLGDSDHRVRILAHEAIDTIRM